MKGRHTPGVDIDLILGSLLLVAFLPDGHTEVTLDGSLGPKGALKGPNYRIGAELGRRAGSNLFHSFGRFNIGSKESATFTGPAAVDNVFGRVTKGPSLLILLVWVAAAISACRLQRSSSREVKRQGF